MSDYQPRRAITGAPNEWTPYISVLRPTEAWKPWVKSVAEAVACNAKTASFYDLTPRRAER